MIKAIFIAPSHAQASFWAQQWGFGRNEWRYCGHATGELNDLPPRELLGYRDPPMPAFVCGSEGPSSITWVELALRGFEVYDAETLAA